MRTLISAFLFSWALFSCDSTRTQDNSREEIPAALEDKSSSYEIVSSRGYDDLVESLYKELANNSPDLRALELQIEKLNDSKSDSLEHFNKYNSKNKSYYHASQSLTEQVKDTVIKEKMKLLIKSSLTNYGSLVTKHSDIIDLIDKNTITLNDLHILLKVTRTLPLIEKFQRDNLPSKKPLEDYSKQLNSTMLYADSLSKK